MRDPIIRNVLRLALGVVLAMPAAACEQATDSSTTTTPSAATTETFTGTVKQLGTTTHAFAVSTSGAIAVQLVSVEPLATMALGVGIGTWDGSTCSEAIASNKDVRAGDTALTGTAVAGNYCVRVYDSGNIAEGGRATYSVQVTHP